MLAEAVGSNHTTRSVKIKDHKSNIPYVTEIYRTSGRYDLLVKIHSDAEDKLKEIVSKDIGMIHGVDDTIALIIS